VRTFRTYATARNYPLSAPNGALRADNPQVNESALPKSIDHVLSQGGDGDSANCHHTAQGALLKSARARMNIISASRQVGSYRDAAELCGTTHKTVKRVIERAEASGPPPREPRPRNVDAFTELVAIRVEKSKGKMSAKRTLPSSCGRLSGLGTQLPPVSGRAESIVAQRLPASAPSCGVVTR
jgi:hypothetical protein